ncbi:5'-3' exonuclease [Actinopolymorpha alba]|uniref:5'-3' exonuclease n=1 Tax=Actinopolymorpha alba TaxID=533267 RepID=UPI00037F8291|nr:5'-3' exonuclease H3TH domain-containing protein [Actinopolymorpha alba]
MPHIPLLLVDGHNLLWRAWFGFPARIRSRDKTRDVTGVFGFFALLRVAVRELPVAPEIAVVFDGENAWDQRLDIDPTYKAHRPTDDEAMAPIRSLATVMRGLELLRIPQVVSDTAEADDVIATLVRRTHLRSRGRDVWIMSVDRDYYQLLAPRVKVLNTARRAGERIVAAEDVEARFGITPRRWCDRVSLVGDPSDGIPGVRGIGNVTAARLLAGGLAVENLPASGRLTGRIGTRVRQSFPRVLLWKQLAKLRGDLAITAEVTGQPAPPLPKAAEVLERLDLW